MHFLPLITAFMATTAIAVPASLALRPDVTAIDAAVDAAVAAEAADGKPLLWCYICALWYEQCLDVSDLQPESPNLFSHQN